MLLLHPILTFAPCVLTFAPYIQTFGPCASGVSLLSTGANIPLAQVVVVTSCNLRQWCFSIQPLARIVHLHTWWHHPLQLALVVLFRPSTGANTALAPVQLALCGGGLKAKIIINNKDNTVLCITSIMHMHTCSSYSQKWSRSPLLPAVPSTAATVSLWRAIESISATGTPIIYIYLCGI